MKKKIVSLLCAVMVTGCLVGCGGENASEKTAGNTDSQGTDDTVTETETVVVSFLAFSLPNSEDEAAVEKAMNELLKDKGIAVDLLIMDAASYGQQIPLMLSGNEQLDLFSALSVGFNNMVNNGYALDLEENNLLQTYGQGIIEEMGDYLDGCRVGGVLYGLPQNRDLASPGGWAIVNEYLDAIDYEYDPNGINQITEEELDNIFARLHEKFPDKIVVVAQPVARTAIFCDYPGGDWYGVLMDPANSLELTDLYSSQEYMDYCKKFYEYNQLGYISGDALTDQGGSNLLVSTGKAMAYGVGLKPGMAQQESTSNGKATSMFQTDTKYLMASGTFANMPWCVNSNTEHPEAAMKLLNEFYTNPALSDLLIYGVEGKHYVVNEDGLYTYPEGMDAGTVGYHPNVAPFMFNEFIAGVWEGNEADVWEQTAKMNDNATLSLAMGFTFDNSALTAEYTALNNIYEEYRYQLEYGFLDPEVGIPEMVERMKAAGLDKYIEEKQKQLNEWSENK